MEKVHDETVEEMFLKRDGRLNRLRYFKRSMVIFLASMIINIPVITICSDDFGNLSPSVFLSIVYLVNVVIFLYLLFASGTKGENKYGADPLG